MQHKHSPCCFSNISIRVCARSTRTLFTLIMKSALSHILLTMPSPSNVTKPYGLSLSQCFSFKILISVISPFPCSAQNLLVAPLDDGQVHPLFHLLEMYWTKVWSLVVVACFSSWLNIGAISVAGRNGRDFNLGT